MTLGKTHHKPVLTEAFNKRRVTLADLSKKMFRMTLPATKCRFDRLVAEGCVQDYLIISS